jgi:hypothetical protein
VDSKYKPLLEKSFRVVQMFADPSGYARDTINRGMSEIRENIRFYILGEINKEAEIRHDMAQDVFTNEERLRWFGKEQLSFRDLTWESCERLLRPSAIENAVVRVNEAMAGSRNNEVFSRNIEQRSADGLRTRKAIYTPRTVTFYDSKEQAMAAAKLLRIITRGSDARILAEEINTGSLHKQWVVSDDMDLKTHNSVRMFMAALERSDTKSQKKEHQERSQEEVNKRLPKGEEWEAWPGVGTLLTLQGRPGVKMYKTLPDGKDDPEDVRLVGLVRPQRAPEFLRGVPHSMIDEDGRMVVDPSDQKSVVSHIIMGKEGTRLMRGDVSAAGRILVKEANTEYVAPIHEQSLAGKVARGVEVVMGAPGHVIEKPVKGLVGLATGLSAATLMAVGTGAHKIAKVAYGLRRYGDTGYYREPGSVVDVGKRWVEGQLGGRPSRSQHYKEWKHRENISGVLQGRDIVDLEFTRVDELDNSLRTPAGELDVVPRFASHWVAHVQGANQAEQFMKFMRTERRWPSVEEVCAGRYHFPVKELPESLNKAIDEYASAYAYWVITQQKERHLQLAISKGEVSKDLAVAINHFNAEVEKIHGLPADTADVLKDKVNDALSEGMQQFILNSAAKELHTAIAGV